MNDENIICDKEMSVIMQDFYECYMADPINFIETSSGALMTTSPETRAMYVDLFKYLLVRDGHKWKEIHKQKILQVLNALNNPKFNIIKRNFRLAFKSPLKFEYEGKEYVYEIMPRKEFDKLVSIERDKIFYNE